MIWKIHSLDTSGTEGRKKEFRHKAKNVATWTQPQGAELLGVVYQGNGREALQASWRVLGLPLPPQPGCWAMKGSSFQKPARPMENKILLFLEEQ